MVRRLKQWLSGEKGQALLIVLGLLAIGGLTIAVSLNYATTSLKGNRIAAEKTEGVYAAGAGVEYAVWSLQKELWSLQKDETRDEETPENINQMAVGIQTQNKGTFTMTFGMLTEVRDQYWKLNVTGTMSWVEGNRYRYEITVTNTASSNQTIHLEAVGARIPVGYHYENNSTTRSDGLTVPNPPPPYNPVITQDDQGADLLNWPWKSWHSQLRPELTGVGDVYTQTFYVTGTGSQGGEYAWVEADPDIIGVVGEFTGTRYRITATARRPESSRTTAEIAAHVIIKDDGTINILSWQITK